MTRIQFFSLFLLLALGTAQAGEESLTLENGEVIKVLFFQPTANTEPAPLALLVSGGSNDEFMARAQFWMGKELVNRGWAVAVPISPQGRNYFVDNAELFPQIITGLHELHKLGAGKSLLVGISSGGSAALAIAAQHPSHYLGVVATPGRIWEHSLFQSLQGLPIYLRVGERDNFLWNRHLDAASDLLTQAGASLDAALVPDARHIFPLDWAELEAWMDTLETDR